jgi:hypothetical protein
LELIPPAGVDGVNLVVLSVVARISDLVAVRRVRRLDVVGDVVSNSGPAATAGFDGVDLVVLSVVARVGDLAALAGEGRLSLLRSRQQRRRTSQ